jgi:hypothetical protein
VSRRRYREILGGAVLALVIALAFCIAYGRTDVQSWATPIGYRGDSLVLLGYLKAAHDGHVIPAASLVIPELNAPFGANWNDHPRTLRVVFMLTGLLARATSLFVAINLLLLAAHVLAGVVFYAVARALGARLEWALATALVFGLSHYFFWRSLDHLDLVLAWHVPLCVMVVTWAFSNRLRSRFLLASGVSVIAALHNPYYACLYAQFLLLAAAAQRLRSGKRDGAWPALAQVAVLAGVFVLDNAGSLAYQLLHGANPAAARPYGNLERLALRPLELVLAPPGFGLGDWGAHLGRVHWEGRVYKGEGFAVYLGLVGAAMLVWLAGVTFARLARRPAQAPPAAVPAIAWILAYSVVGGLNQVAGMAGFVWLRGTNRFSIWILALVLLYLATRRMASRRLSLASAGFVALLAVADQVPLRGSRGEIASTGRVVAADRHFVREVEAALPARAMLFMMPVTEFPEGRRVLGFEEYDHLRPYLFSSRLRFSFGTDKGRPRDAWQREVEAQPPARLADALESCGFAGILLNLRAYEDDAREFLAAMRVAGHQVRVAHTAGDYVLIGLTPAASDATSASSVIDGTGCHPGPPRAGSGGPGP